MPPEDDLHGIRKMSWHKNLFFEPRTVIVARVTTIVEISRKCRFCLQIPISHLYIYFNYYYYDIMIFFS